MSLKKAIILLLNIKNEPNVVVYRPVKYNKFNGKWLALHNKDCYVSFSQYYINGKINGLRIRFDHESKSKYFIINGKTYGREYDDDDENGGSYVYCYDKDIRIDTVYTFWRGYLSKIETFDNGNRHGYSINISNRHTYAYVNDVKVFEFDGFPPSFIMPERNYNLFIGDMNVYTT